MFSVKQVADRLAVSAAVVYRLIDSGQLEAHRIGLKRGTLRISEQQIEAYLEKSKVNLSQPCSSKKSLKHIQY